MPVIDDPAISDERERFAEAQGTHWIKVHADALNALPHGTTVIINVTTGDYVTGTSWLAALEAYEQKFGRGRTLSWSYEVGRPLFVGGGVWRS